MAYMSKRVDQYQVVLTTSNETPNDDFSGRVARIRLFWTSAHSKKPLETAIHFVRSRRDGFIGEASIDGVKAYVDADQYEHHLHLLQSESPVNFGVVFDGDSGEISHFALATGDEPPGEGFEDKDTTAGL